jgi:hypothetical protein
LFGLIKFGKIGFYLLGIALSNNFGVDYQFHGSQFVVPGGRIPGTFFFEYD